MNMRIMMDESCLCSLSTIEILRITRQKNLSLIQIETDLILFNKKNQASLSFVT